MMLKNQIQGGQNGYIGYRHRGEIGIVDKFCLEIDYGLIKGCQGQAPVVVLADEDGGNF